MEWSGLNLLYLGANAMLGVYRFVSLRREGCRQGPREQLLLPSAPCLQIFKNRRRNKVNKTTYYSDDEEQNVLRQFYVVAADRLKRIFDTKRYRERFIFTIRDSNLEANNLPIEEGISTFETLFNDCLGEIMVLISITQF